MKGICADCENENEAYDRNGFTNEALSNPQITCCGKDDVLDDFDDDVDLQVGLLTQVSCTKHNTLATVIISHVESPEPQFKTGEIKKKKLWYFRTNRSLKEIRLFCCDQAYTRTCKHSSLSHAHIHMSYYTIFVYFSLYDFIE